MADLIVAPEPIARQLEAISKAIEPVMDSDMVLRMQTALATAANNMRMLFELSADDKGRFKPRNMGEVWFLTDILMRSGTAPSSYDNDPAKIAIGIMKAVEIDVEPITGLANIMIVNNRPTVWGDLAQALIQRSGTLVSQKVEEIGTQPADGLELKDWPTDYGWRVTSTRKDHKEPYVGTFTVADAKRASLWMNSRKQPWITDPKRMLFNRARARSQRDGFSDCLFGMQLAEEAFDYERVASQAAPLAISAPTDDDEPVTMIEHQQVEPMTDFGSAKPLETEQGDLLAATQATADD